MLYSVGVFGRQGMNSIDVVVFDVWGTLLRLEPMWGFISSGLASVANRSVNAARSVIARVRSIVKSRVGILDEDHVTYSVKLLAKELGVSEAVARRGIALGVLEALEHVEELVYDDARLGLEKAREIASYVGVVGNALLWPSSYTRLILEKSRLGYFIDAQVYGDEIGYYKPSPRIWARLFTELGLGDQPSCIHVGDSLREDAAGALSTGCRAILIRRGGEPLHCPGLGVFIITSLSQLSEAMT